MFLIYLLTYFYKFSMNYFQRMHADGHILENCDWQCYLDRYQDLKDNYGTDFAAAEDHWINEGRSEGLDCTCGNFFILLMSFKN